MRSTIVTPIRGVKLQHIYNGIKLSPKTYHSATKAAAAWSDNIARNIADRNLNLTFTVNKFVQYVWDSTEYQSAYDRAYRRSLKIFKQILP